MKESGWVCDCDEWPCRWRRIWRGMVVKEKREFPHWIWGVIGVLVMAWFAYWIGKGR